jgi:hypothetical protein
MGGGSEVGIALSAAATGQKHPLIVFVTQVLEKLTGLLVVYSRSWRHLDDGILAVSTMTATALSRSPVLGPKSSPHSQVRKGLQVRTHLEHDAAPAAAVATVGPSLGHVLLPPERHSPMSTVSGGNQDSRLIYESLHLTQIPT